MTAASDLLEAVAARCGFLATGARISAPTSDSLKAKTLNMLFIKNL
jgi:hypothetical protein